MKTITIRQVSLDKLLLQVVDSNEPGFKIDVARANLRKTVLGSFISPLEAQKSGDLEFLRKYIKCKDIIMKALETTDEEIFFEDADFDFLYDVFTAFGGWNPSMARIILFAGDSLRAVKETV